VTLILSRSSYRFVLQLSDRLVTAETRPFDSTSNKTVLFHALGGTAVLSYTGISFIGDVPTDQWIAQQLTGLDLTQFEKPPAFRFWGPPSKIGFGIALYNLAGQVQLIPDHIPNDPWLSSWIAQPFEIAINGWQWNSKGDVRPIIAWIEKPPGTIAAALGFAERNWYAGRAVCIGATPSGYIDAPSIDGIANDLRGLDPDQSESVLAGAVRAVAASTPFVGPDLMSVLLAPPYTGFARVKFLPTTHHALELRGGGRRLTMPAAFTPWIAGPSSLHAPALISRSSEVGLGPYVIRIIGPGSGAPLSVISGQARRKRSVRRH